MIANDRANFITNVLRSVHETGIDIISLTFGPQYNFAMANILGANLQVDKVKVFKVKLQVFFPHFITKNQYIILDACHMIKLIRNCFAEYKVLQNKNNEEIRFDFIEKLIY